MSCSFLSKRSLRILCTSRLCTLYHPVSSHCAISFIAIKITHSLPLLTFNVYSSAKPNVCFAPRCGSSNHALHDFHQLRVAHTVLLLTTLQTHTAVLLEFSDTMLAPQKCSTNRRFNRSALISDTHLEQILKRDDSSLFRPQRRCRCCAQDGRSNAAATRA